nr:MAG TPA: hypothetical protein [Caudoviricetes sp.]
MLYLPLVKHFAIWQAFSLPFGKLFSTKRMQFACYLAKNRPVTLSCYDFSPNVTHFFPKS